MEVHIFIDENCNTDWKGDLNMNYSSIEPFIRDYGIRRAFFCGYFKKKELEGETKNEIQSSAIKEDIVKSPRVLDTTFKFYEEVKDKIDWVSWFQKTQM